MKVFGLAGWSGSGKTTLVVDLIPEISSRGLTVSTMKHTHHRFDIDRPGKDSFNHREAGAQEVMIASSTRWALMQELRDKPEPDIQELISHMSPVDLVLIEGFKSYPHPKIEVYRPSIGKPVLFKDDPSVVAMATNEAMTMDINIPLLDLDDIVSIADYILAHVGLTTEVRSGTA
jgi:molybdopterin-guanine dinucleotide biosynthesis protein B